MVPKKNRNLRTTENGAIAHAAIEPLTLVTTAQTRRMREVVVAGESPSAATIIARTAYGSATEKHHCLEQLCMDRLTAEYLWRLESRRFGSTSIQLRGRTTPLSTIGNTNRNGRLDCHRRPKTYASIPLRLSALFQSSPQGANVRGEGFLVHFHNCEACLKMLSLLLHLRLP